MIVRNHQKKPFRKGTNEEIAERIDFVVDMMRADPSVTKWKIIKAVRRKYQIEWRQTTEYIANARKLIDKASDVTQNQALKIVTNAIINQIKHGRNVVQAARLFAEIKGLFAPRRIEQTGLDGGPIKIEGDLRPLKDVPADRLRELAQGVVVVEETEQQKVEQKNGTEE